MQAVTHRHRVPLSVMIMAGGTGGHVFPGLAVAECFKARGVPVVWMGTRRGLENDWVPRAGIPLERIAIAGLRGSGLKRLLQAPFMLVRAVSQALAILRRRRPRLVLGMGGFASGPGGVAARCLRIPLLIHEQNAVVGLTNRCLARLADQVLEAFPGSFPASRRAVLVGNPVRADIAALPDPSQRFAARSGPPRLLILGGSQGARKLNELLPQALAKLALAAHIRHQSGSRHHEQTLAAYRRAGVAARVDAFIADMAQAYGWADLVLCRCGALTVSELSAAGVAALLVPFPRAVDDHQTANARFLQRSGAAQIIQESELDADRLSALLDELLGDRQRLRTMAEAARRQARPDAAQQVATLCLQQVAL